MLKKTFNFIKNYYMVFIISILLWLVLNESLSLLTFIESIGVAIVTALSIHLLLGENNHYANHEHLSILMLLRYIIVLIIAIYKSTLTIIQIILFDNPVPKFVKFQSGVENKWHRCLIANSITLTPGTISVDDTGKEITVLWIKPTTRDKSEYGQIIQGDFEKIFTPKESTHV